ncbi:MAG: hypothetical protein ACRDM1_00010 [Gaiellaceae bacterium]
MSSLLKVAAAACIVATTFLTAAVAPPAARAATPCWKLLLNDWYDGRIDQTYPIHCYRDALKHLPADVQTYSSAHDDILRALQTAISRERKQGKKVGQGTLVPPQKGGGSGGAGGGTGGGGTATGSATGGSGGGAATDTNGTPGRKEGGGLADKLNPSSPSSLPVPLLVLGALALLLVAAGAAGLVAKRIQSRRPRG